MLNLVIYYLKKVLFKLSKKEQFVGNHAYRKYLFEELINTFGKDQFNGKRFLEIGPKDGEDTERLHSLNPKEFIMFELPDKSEQNEKGVMRKKRKH